MPIFYRNRAIACHCDCGEDFLIFLDRTPRSIAKKPHEHAVKCPRCGAIEWLAYEPDCVPDKFRPSRLSPRHKKHYPLTHSLGDFQTVDVLYHHYYAAYCSLSTQLQNLLALCVNVLHVWPKYWPKKSLPNDFFLLRQTVREIKEDYHGHPRCSQNDADTAE